MNQAAPPAPGTQLSLDWELDFFSRPVLDPGGKKRWDLLITATPAKDSGQAPFRWAKNCPANTVNSVWLQGALNEALLAAAEQGLGAPRRLRCWRATMRTMVQRAAETIGLEVIPSRRCYALVEWLSEREREVYPAEEGYMAGPLAPPPLPMRSLPLPLPEAARGDSWDWVSLPLGALREAPEWEIGFEGLFPLPDELPDELVVPGLRLFSRTRSLAIAGWIAGLEPARLEMEGANLVLEAGLEDRWRLATLAKTEASEVTEAFAAARTAAAGLQFIAVQSEAQSERFDGFWLLRDMLDC
ncbi:Tab2/Atab2 family RNA-binding protein [Synechococcus sp. RedBA-s]|uniref:Tab2/Atab2 family RNA-binding protein n=1 Tax=Synechococcus sp. RedBA-s TaxID=2823741 RepID=UPI0020CF15B8|nr:Tab2/Atab2 family RNA-binding protein [Synechococcus sp. RedBA-s]MCP9800025.1 Tab2/Atab2 family RNA-binding protein [Synechococcus sp. RedBA-s]